MKRYVLSLFLFLILTSFLTGCWNRRELNEIAIAVGMGLDKVGKQYRVSVQVVNPKEVASGKGQGLSPAILYTTEGDTILEAVRRMSTLSPRKIYFSHLRMLLIGESLAREGMAESLDLLQRDQEIRSDFYLVVTQNSSAEEVLKIMTPLEKVPANKLFNTLETSEKYWSPSLTDTLDETIRDLIDDGKHPVLSGLRIVGDPKVGVSKKNVENIDISTELKDSGLAAFKEDKLIGWLNEEESKGYNYIRGNVKSTAGHVDCLGGGKLTTEVVRTKAKIKGRVVQGQPQVNVTLQAEQNIAAVECRNLELIKTETIRQIEKESEAEIISLMESAIKKAQNSFGADIFGFGEAIRRADPKAWKKMKEDWDERYFTDLPVHIKVKVKIRRIGTVGDSFLNNTKE
ncbi:Ger(x)C family spore germination protein [Paenibacillus sp. N3/727]|uniref:Ger(x)C family spore germination protein n=1 Tax=Paenibacillus sp. N3/727 TaxID=2925845 RepID=UPI001F5313B5|nr:Ger(x)C family spore germination protein [Paenibacillus sp. N3/727]UNK16847.1 Ger(x)C family spore germination protein [Paenibacillus sp. N3/727]